MRDFAIQLTHRPGELARVASSLSRKGVNIKSLAALTLGSQALVRIIADDVEAARSALKESNIRFEEAEVVQILMENQAGKLAEAADKLAMAGVNLHALYVTGVADGLVELVFVADDPKKVKKLLG